MLQTITQTLKLRTLSLAALLLCAAGYVQAENVAKIGETEYETIAEAVTAATEGQAIEVFVAGEYTLPNLPKNITIEGTVDGVVFNHTSAGNIASIPNGATFKNATFNFGNNNYHGFQHAGAINMEGCTLNGKFFSYGDMNFTNCQFVQANSDYHMWCYSGNLTYTGCTFTNNATGKFLNIYNEDGSTKYTVTLNKCSFINKASASKAALNVKATCGSKLLAFDVIINNCTTEGAFPEASTSDALVVLNNVVQVDDRTADGTDNITVTQDGKQIYPEPIAKIGDTIYTSLAAAVAAVPADGTEATITMIGDEAVVAGVTVGAGQNIVLELNGKTISGNTDSSKTYALITNKGTLTIQDNTDTNADGTGTGLITTYIANPDGGDVPGYASNTITNNGYLTVKSGKIVNNGSGYACYAIDTQTNGTAFTPTLMIEGGRMQQMNAYTYAVRMFCNSTTNVNSVKVSGGVIEGGYGLWLQTPNNKANMASLTITGGILNANDGAALYVGGTKADNSNISINIDGGQINGTGVIIQGPLSGTYGEVAITDGEIVKVQCGANVEDFISGGTYSEEPDAEYLAEGFVAAKKGDVYVVIPASELPTAPIIFHDAGEYESALDVAIAGEGTIKYTLNGGAEQTYSAPIKVSETTTITAWAEADGIKSDEVSKTFTIVTKETPNINLSGYYTIQTSEGKYMNVAGRKTVTLNSDTKSAGTVLKVEAENGLVKELRSQAVDLPRYAERAMSYVPDLVKALMARLGENDVIGEQGADLIATEFTDKFDYHLYLEEAAGGYRIYGKTPSMSLVVDFYAKNKELIDSRLPKVEGFVEDILLKVADRLGHAGSDWAKKFKIHDLWTTLGGETSGLTEPVEGDEAAIGKFYTEVLSSEKNIWNFAHETMLIYWDKVESYLNGNEQSDIDINLGDYSKYISRIKNIQPDFKYYIVPDASGVDIISEGNEAIINNAASAVWTLAKRSDFNVTFNEENTLSGKYYTTFYADFAYTLPEGVKAYKVTEINEKTGVAKREEITGTIPAQTPVLLEAESTGDKALVLTTEAGTAVTGNLLVGPDELINEYEINSSTAEDVFILLEKLSSSLAEEYEYLKRKNAGTVNNKYFFGLDADDLNLCTYKNENNEDVCVVRNLSTGDEKLGFYGNWKVEANKAFLVSETFDPVKLFLKGDVNRDGNVTIADVTALVNIILGKAKYPDDNDKYDFDAADVNEDNTITIADVTALVNIILGK